MNKFTILLLLSAFAVLFPVRIAYLRPEVYTQRVTFYTPVGVNTSSESDIAQRSGVVAHLRVSGVFDYI